MPKYAASPPEGVTLVNIQIGRNDHTRLTRRAAVMAEQTGRAISYAEVVQDMLDRLDRAQEDHGPQAERCHACGRTDCPAAGKPYVDDCPGWQDAEARLARGGYLPTRPLPLPGSREEASGD